MTASQLARRAHLSGARERQGGLRREAARDLLGRARTDSHRNLSNAPGNDRLVVGFNRRFAPLLVDLRSRFGRRGDPSVVRYLVSAGPLAWELVSKADTEGSRFEGEGGHFIDTISWWLDARPVEVHAVASSSTDDLLVSLRFDDDSIASIGYTTVGGRRFPKETFEASASGRPRGWTTSDGPRSGPAEVAAPNAACAARTRASGNNGRIPRRRPVRWPHADLVVVARGDDPRHTCRHVQPRQRSSGTGLNTRARWLVLGRVRDECQPAKWPSEQSTTRAVRFGSVGKCVLASRPSVVRSTEPRAVPNSLLASAVLEVPAIARDALVSAANQLVGGEWEVLGVVRDDLRAPDWFLDPVTGRRAPQARYAFRINHRSEDETGNVKQVWELSRHHHLTILAAAGIARATIRYAEAVDRQLRSWWNENPFLSGVHWTNGIELGVRLIAWTWIRRLLDEWPGIADLFERNDDRGPAAPMAPDLSGRIPEPGLFGEQSRDCRITGQLIASCAFPWFAESDKWRRRATRVARARARAQHVPERPQPGVGIRLSRLRRRARSPRCR